MRAGIFLFAYAVCQGQTGLNVTSGLDGMVDRYLTEIARAQWEARARTVAAIHTPAEVSRRQAYIRKKMLEEVGGLPEKTPLNARITGTVEHNDYRVEKLVYE